MSAAGKNRIRVVLVKSPFGTGRRHMACVRGLGLRRRHDARVLEDSPAVRGMIREVSYMLKCEYIDAS